MRVADCSAAMNASWLGRLKPRSTKRPLHRRVVAHAHEPVAPAVGREGVALGLRHRRVGDEVADVAVVGRPCRADPRQLGRERPSQMLDGTHHLAGVERARDPLAVVAQDDPLLVVVERAEVGDHRVLVDVELVEQLVQALESRLGLLPACELDAPRGEHPLHAAVADAALEVEHRRGAGQRRGAGGRRLRLRCVRLAVRGSCGAGAQGDPRGEPTDSRRLELGQCELVRPVGARTACAKGGGGYAGAAGPSRITART